ncbi:chromophore lyase CpcT/CpeT [Romeria aff. gracilis LEGE 07310]|uniref:Chromophore lyase CpcT/CpeT n=1 Tax=Vasconcelosia minhoensis LEGE 07310 TaxID=915328 RepID=A0A8J7DMK0_9CYAN|nr:chromophore lyase CpcT/CpeT [Romeria gracilis]MBE9076835.1 chromophore lyase CpcT/CpeT [Romeria aff. gracilis LEGE 07310]
MASPFQQLASALAGEFENQAQVAADPAWYVHLRLWQRPILALSAPSENSVMLFLEQVNLASETPYRQRLLQLKQSDCQLRAEYYALRQPHQFQGAGQQPALLANLTENDCIHLPDCELGIELRSEIGSPAFKATLPEGQLCAFEVNGQRKYVYLGFEVNATDPNGPTELLIFDKGIDPETKKALWGALMGPYRLVKQQDYSSDWGF